MYLCNSSSVLHEVPRIAFNFSKLFAFNILGSNGYVTNKTLPFINTRIHAKIEKIYQKRYLSSLKKRGTYVKVQSN